MERINAVVGQMLRCLIHEDRVGNWDSYLTTVEMTINSYPNSSTGYSPFFLNYGYHPIAPVELLKGAEDIKIEAVQNFVSRGQHVWNKGKEKSVKFSQKTIKIL